MEETTAPVETQEKKVKNVLIVEDEDTIRKLLAIECKQHGYTIIEFRDAAEAMRVIDKTKPQIDYAIVDLMNMGYGGNLGDSLRKHTQYRTTMIIYYTALTDKQFNKKILDAPNTFYIHKIPGSIKTVINKITGVM